ncbi:protein-disulfide reductase DsbD domain-containing protein [Acidipila sp. EB88]|uniref:protein-disulfide reductase DsbD domain-containing protein n=1 Tax=Acidipila sp. EB88 TaxID=2305226 RepID=UPI000F5DA985|nr:protein-disulfide reductase DsbD domain-containing protein [Acidipila sp. EB88]
MPSLRLTTGLAVAALLLACSLGAQDMPWQTHKPAAAQGEPVQYVFPEQAQLIVGEPHEVDLHFRIREGLHINSHVPRDKGFIRTELIVVERPGVVVQAVIFPEGAEFSSKAFPGEKLSVYTGEVVLHARLKASRPGEQMLAAALRYQACDADACLPPKTAPVALDIVAR